ncbi:hypothetical protein GGX14DRAFT_556172 [Mycena pura]|uniref:Uncharacterized protein n=1 Tax=Mycena pura TaxID=153505 RepID=A0AAD6YP15_9AGAR|nr:hypothetical protein GGX14DRAFT_556172 [Mycena pura]
MDDTCVDGTYAATNPDIAGIGVRFAIHAPVFAPIALWTFIATSFGLTIATIVQHQSDAQLTLYQGLQVSNLVWLANFGTFVALASYSRQKAASHNESNIRVGPDYNVKFGAMMQTVFSMALTLYMWSNANTFGNVSECSHLINYVVFVIKVPALGAGKIIGLTASAMLTAAYVWVTLHELRSYRTGSRQKDSAAAEHCILATARPMPKTPSLTTVPTVHDLQSYPPPSVISIAAHQNGSRARVPGAEETVLHMIQKRRPRRRRWSYEVDPMLIGEPSSMLTRVF